MVSASGATGFDPRPPQRSGVLRVAARGCFTLSRRHEFMKGSLVFSKERWFP